jgi:hypothetical protein
MKILTVKVKAGRAVRKYQVVKSDGPNDLVFQSVKDGKPNPRRQHPDALHQTCSKEAGPWLGKLAQPPNFPRGLVEDGRCGRKGRARPNAALEDINNAGHYQQFVPESQQRVVEKLNTLARIN